MKLYKNILKISCFLILISSTITFAWYNFSILEYENLWMLITKQIEYFPGLHKISAEWRIANIIASPLLSLCATSIYIYHIVINAKPIVKYIALGAEKRAVIKAERAAERTAKKIEKMQKKIQEMKDGK